jgi:hypothetical protein
MMAFVLAVVACIWQPNATQIDSNQVGKHPESKLQNRKAKKRQNLLK